MFTSLILASNFALTAALNIKLEDTLVFSAAFAFGFRIGASVAILSELIWSLASPYGFGGYIIPFLVLGELLFVLAGSFASRVWRRQDLSFFSLQNFFFGGILSICAFVWDFETNLATGLLVLWPSLITMPRLLGFEIAGLPFMIPHELSDFLLGSLLAPVIIVYFWRKLGGKAKPVLAPAATQPS